MLVWVGLLIVLASALLKSWKDLAPLPAPPRTVQVLKEYAKSNGFALTTAGLAVAGFLVAGVSSVVQQRGRAAEIERLISERENLEALAMVGRSVEQRVRLVVETSDARLEEGFSREIAEWHETRDPNELPRPVGFMPSRARAALFPDAVPVDLIRWLGQISVAFGRPEWRINLAIRDDGAIIPVTTANSYRSVDLRASGSRLVIDIEGEQQLDSLAVYRDVIGGYQQETIPFRVRVFGAASGENARGAVDELTAQRARVSVFLDAQRQIALSALLETGLVKYENNGGVVEWRYAERPTMLQSGPDGRLFGDPR